ncbi:hypothetical protein [Herbaspirillum robiniae]|uniref:hypothetical protein n=1 Tax=Herbaspirillum robiniae TaxID=2014887 RepID=UPI00101AE906|nr:hypothetical protein [Herbaspirillum robiniae]
MRHSTEYCIDLPDDFPEQQLVQYMAVARKTLLQPQVSQAWSEFAGASNLLAWRYRASFEDWQYYKNSVVECQNPTHEDLYRRERALFGMFTAGVSCIESACYSLAALASHPSVLSLPFGEVERRQCTPPKLYKWLLPYAKAAQLTSALDKLLKSDEWDLWMDLRNRMSHRSNLPNVVTAWIGDPPPSIKPIHFAATSSTPAIEAETTDFDALHEWLVKTLGALLAGGAQLP